MLIKTNPEEFPSYLEDTSNLKGRAELLYLAAEKGEVIDIVRDCRGRRLPFTLCSARTGTTGGCVPLQGAVVSLENLKKIIDIDQERQIIYLEAGVSLGELEKEANKYNLTLRASPTEELALLGGAISTSASGVRGFGYGSIRNYVQALEVVLPSGEIINIRRGGVISQKRTFDFEYRGRKSLIKLPSYNLPSVKSQAGYFIKDNMDLIDLFIGSEGTLGIIVSCALSLQRLPLRVFDGLVFFREESQALEFVDTVKRLKEMGQLHPASLEFFDRNSLEMLKQEYSFIPPYEAAIYFEQEVEDDKYHLPLLKEWSSLIEKYGASLDNSILAETLKDREKLFSFRHRLPQLINEFLRHNNQIKAAADIAVPWENFFKMYNFYKDKGEEAGINYVNFGHIGEGHLHFNFLPKNEEESLRARKYLMLFVKQAVSLKGTVSAEHGIGKIKKPYLKVMYNRREIKEMALLKKQLDPRGFLGLDNIFDKEVLLNTD